MASGTHQSPIDIDPSTAEFDSDLAAFPLKISYRDESNKVCATLISAPDFHSIYEFHSSPSAKRPF